ncbi:hypothetical protein [Azonexus hydrophilus]|uniref:Uncharacterized protein n=1 Tax=Azonexus hydrophilus TaxID=418702 RepID=A0ABZ2XLL6_9RHOO
MELLLDLRRKRLEFFGEKRDMLQTHPNRRIHIAFHFQRENTRTNRQRLKMLNPTMAAMANIAMHAFVILAQRKNITVNDVRRSYRSAKVKVLEFGTAHRVSFSWLSVNHDDALGQAVVHRQAVAIKLRGVNFGLDEQGDIAARPSHLMIRVVRV